jgi:hypothetical protein
LSAFAPNLVLPGMDPVFRDLLARLRDRLPPNWPAHVDFDELTMVMWDDGIPMVWVPRAEIVTEVLAPPDRDARVQVLLSHTTECQ